MERGRGQWEAMRTGGQADLTQEVRQGRSNVEKCRLRMCVCYFSLLKMLQTGQEVTGIKFS